MKFFATIVITFLMATPLFAQEEQEFVSESSCSLSIKTTAYPVDSSDKFGKVTIEALLTDNKGNPLPGQQIRITATNGAFTCMPPVSFSDAEISSSVEGCLQTQEDGTVKIYLVHIPFNQPGNVKAMCAYGNFKVSAVGAYVIKKFTKSTAAKKSRSSTKPRKRIPISGEP
jgi:hypothetical protein